MPIDLDSSVILSSGAGAVAGQIVNRSADSTVRKVLEAIGGMLCGTFCGLPVADQFQVKVETQRVAVCFLVGAVGLLVLTFLMDKLKRFDSKSWLSRWINIPEEITTPKEEKK